MGKFTPPFLKLHATFKTYWQTLPAKASRIAKNEFLDNFERQGYRSDIGFSPWEKRKGSSFGKQRAILIKSGRLRRSLNIRPLPGLARVEANSPYAAIHHNGGLIQITPKMRSFFWAMYYKHGKGLAKGKSIAAKNLNSEAGKWKALALKKDAIKIPKRPFMAHNRFIVEAIESMVANDLNSLFKNSR